MKYDYQKEYHNYIHNGTHQLELLFRDSHGNRTLHMSVGGVNRVDNRLVIGIGKRDSKHIEYRFVSGMGRDVVARHGSIHVKHYDGMRVVSSRPYSYTISVPPVHTGGDGEPFGIELVTDLSPHIKLYTTYISVSHVAIEMIVVDGV
jgi:hypothetical protein